jgi:hypothetical protein
METSLLASQDILDSEPLLSSGPYVEVEDEPSPLERIIAESSGTPLLLLRLDHPVATLVRPINERPNDARVLVSIMAGSLWLLHCGLVWGSYVTDSWSDTHLRVTVDWSLLPNSGVDVVLRSMNLASIFVMLKSSKDEILLWLVFLSALVVPCMMTLLFPMWICNDYCQTGIDKSTTTPGQLARLAVESCIRLGLAVVYHFLLLDVTMYPLEWKWTGTKVQILNQARGGLVAYVLGISAALLVIVVLRAARRAPRSSCMRSVVITDNQSAQQLTNERAAEAVIINGDANFDLYAIDHDAVQPPSLSSNHSWLKRFLALQVGLISFLLWIPAMALPMFRVTYGGLISNLMKNRSMLVYLWNIPSMLWTRGVEAETDQWMLIVLGATLVFSVLIFPIVACLLACYVWITSDASKRYKLRRYLFLVHPMTCGLMFTVMSIQTIRKLSVLGDFLFDEVVSATVCKYSESVINASCLTVTGELSTGIWYLLAQSIVLETFVWLTMWCSQ